MKNKTSPRSKPTAVDPFCRSLTKPIQGTHRKYGPDELPPKEREHRCSPLPAACACGNFADKQADKLFSRCTARTSEHSRDARRHETLSFKQTVVRIAERHRTLEFAGSKACLVFWGKSGTIVEGPPEAAHKFEVRTGSAAITVFRDEFETRLAAEMAWKANVTLSRAYVARVVESTRLASMTIQPRTASGRPFGSRLHRVMPR